MADLLVVWLSMGHCLALGGLLHGGGGSSMHVCEMDGGREQRG